MLFQAGLSGLSRAINILVVSPSNKGGSWRSTKLLLDRLKPYLGSAARFIVCSGRTARRIDDKGYQHIMIRVVDPYRVQDLLPGFFLFSLMYLFVGLCALILCFMKRPRIVVVNGVIPSFLFLFCRLRGAGPLVVVEYHGSLENVNLPRPILRLLRVVLNAVVDVAVVNSVGSSKDLSRLLRKEKIVIIEHPINNVFFDNMDRERARRQLGLGKGDFVVVFVGHLTFEKGVDILVKTISIIANRKISNNIKFIIVGDGRFREIIKHLEENTHILRYDGYVAEPEKLALYYAAADLVWSYADETYLARPAAEALAIGTPVLIPDTPAVLRKRLSGRRVPANLVEEPIGFIVRSDRVEDIAKLILTLARNRERLIAAREEARRYALRRYNPLRLEALARLIARRAGAGRVA